VPGPTPAYVKNTIRHSLREIVDPNSTKEDKERKCPAHYLNGKMTCSNRGAFRPDGISQHNPG